MQGKTRYYISDEKEESAWGGSVVLKPQWNWYLDVTFREDLCRARIRCVSLSKKKKWAISIDYWSSNVVTLREDYGSMEYKTYISILVLH